MTSGGSAGDADAVGADVVLGGMGTDEADGALHVGEGFLDGGVGLGDMADGEDGVAAAEEGSDVEGGEAARAAGLP